jgi:hypothetical protein
MDARDDGRVGGDGAGGDRKWRPSTGGGRRHLVLANQTIGSSTLQTLLLDRAITPGATFHLVVPATRLSDQQQALVATERLRSIGSEDASVALARHRLERALAALRRQGLVIEGDVGDPDPCTAVRATLAERYGGGWPDEIIVSTLPSRWSRWLSSGIVRRIQRECPVPVTHVEARPTYLTTLRGSRRSEPVAP